MAYRGGRLQCRHSCPGEDRIQDIVLVQDADIFSFSLADGPVPGVDEPGGTIGIGIEGDAVFVAAADLQGVIGGVIVADEYLFRRLLLLQDRPDRLFDEAAAVIGRYDDGEAHGFCLWVPEWMRAIGFVRAVGEVGES